MRRFLSCELTPEVAGDRLVLKADESRITDVLAKSYSLQTQAASQARRANQLKQIGIAIHSYVDTHGSFPQRAMSGEPGAKPESRKPLLSWRVYLLPYLEQDALFKQFRLDEPWDSEHNRKLIARMPAVYSSGDKSLAAAGKTRLVTPMIKNGVFESEGPPVKFSDITDDTSNTVMVVEAAEESAVVWTRPDDLPIDEKAPAKGIFSANAGGALMLFADGSVRHIKKSIDATNLLYLFLRNDGNAVQVP